MKIICLKHSEINFEAYNNCIMQSFQSRIYALSWYLDIFSPGWELLMADEYSYVMPVPVKKKFLFSKSAIQSSGCQQLGIFSTKELDVLIFNEFINAIPAKTYDLRFNSDNLFQYSKIGICTNYIMNLNQSYDDIRKKYKKERLRVLDSPPDIIFEKGENIESYWSFIVGNCNSVRDLHHIEKLGTVFREATERRLLEVWAAKDNKGQLLSAICLMKLKDRIYYLCPASVQQQAMTHLLDKCIQEYAGKELVLDFAASSSPVIARFIESFGAMYEPYPRLTTK